MNISNVLENGIRKSSQLLKSAWRRYRALPTFFKAIIWALIIFDLSILCLLAYIGPGKATQSFYDLGQNLASFRYGWLVLGVILSALYTTLNKSTDKLDVLPSHPLLPAFHVLPYGGFPLWLRIWPERLPYSWSGCTDWFCTNFFDTTAALQQKVRNFDIKE